MAARIERTATSTPCARIRAEEMAARGLLVEPKATHVSQNSGLMNEWYTPLQRS